MVKRFSKSITFDFKIYQRHGVPRVEWIPKELEKRIERIIGAQAVARMESEIEEAMQEIMEKP